MSLFGALSSGVSGLSAQSSALGAIADNVTNVNTIGYKSTEVQFQTLVTKQVSSTKYSPGGVQSAPKKGVDQQGLLQSSTSATDLAISGQGFYVVNEQPEASNGSLFAYTRAGSFNVDKDGFLQNTSGWYLQGWPLLSAGQNTTGFTTVDVGADTYIKGYKNSDGDIISINDNIVSSDDLRPINLNTIGGTASETKNIRLGANLPSGADVGHTEKTNVVVFDTLGNSSNLELVWEKQQENAWAASLETPAGAATLEIHGSDDTDAAPDVFAASGLLEFTGVPTDGETIVITDGSGVAITFEFDTDGSVTETATHRQVDISSSTVTEASDVTPILKTAIDSSNLQGTGRFQANGTDMTITQSVMGAAIGFDVSNILSVNQVSANDGLGTFTVPEIDFAYKHGSRIDFQTASVAPTLANPITMTAASGVISGIAGTFTGWQASDTITLSGSTTAANDGTYSIVSVAADGASITLATTDLSADATETSTSSLVIRNNASPSEVYDNLDTVITPSSTGQAITFRLHEPAQASTTSPFNVTNSVGSVIVGSSTTFTLNDNGASADTITAAAGTFSGYAVGESVTVETTTTAAAGTIPTRTGSGNADDGTYVITAVSVDGSTVSVATGSFSGTAALSNAADTITLNTHTIRANSTTLTLVDGGASADSITAAAGTFNGYETGDVFTLNGHVDSDASITVTGVAADGSSISFATGTVGTAGAMSDISQSITLIRDRIVDTSAFANYTDGDEITITGSEDTANNVSLSIVGTDNANYIEFASGASTTLTTDNNDDEAMKVTIDTDSTGNVDYVDISATTTIAEIVTQLAADINANTGITTPTRFSANGTSLVFEQSSIGDDIDIVMDSTSGNNSTGLITGVWVDSSTLAANTASDGETMAMVETTYGSKKAAISFNGDGTPSEINIDNFDIQWANGASDQEYTSTADDSRIGLFLGNTNINDGMTQFSGKYQINFSSQNGAQFGNFAGISVGEDGVVTALFDNGVTRPVFMVPVATFVNPNRMDSLSGNVYIETDFSGMATVREAGEGGAGSIEGAALEGSTVDLGEEFTAMIVTQQAYSAAAKIITTADEMLDELLRIK